MGKQYNSFEEIDERLKVLSLLRDIEVERLKLSLNRTKSAVHPLQLAGSFKGSIQKILLVFAIKKLKLLFGKSKKLHSTE